MPTAEEFHDLALRMVAAGESVEAISLDPARGEFGLQGGASTEIVESAVVQQAEMLAGLAGLCHALSTELFKRETLCHQYTSDMHQYRVDEDEWLTELKRAQTFVGYPSPGTRPAVPEPPFPGALES